MSLLSISRSPLVLKEVSIIVPASNEASFIEDNIRAIEEALKKVTTSYEIILTEDGSSDGTDVIVEKLAAENSSIIHLHSDERLGKGRAIKRALKASQGKAVIFMDADLATSLNYLSKVFELIEERHDGALGSRNIKGSKVKRPLSRHVTSIAYNLFVNLLFQDGINDHQCGFKGFSRNMLESILGNVESDGFFFDTELLIRAKLRGFSLAEFPVTWVEPEGRVSKVQLLKDGIRMGLELIKLRVRLWRA